MLGVFMILSIIPQSARRKKGHGYSTSLSISGEKFKNRAEKFRQFDTFLAFG